MKSKTARPAYTCKYGLYFLAPICIALLMATQAAAQMGYHQQRHIHLNGTHLSPAAIAKLDQTLGYRVPSGFYWTDNKNGTWGYEGNSKILGSIFLPRDRNMSGRANPRRPKRTRAPLPRPEKGGGVVIVPKDSTGEGGVINTRPGGCSYITVGGTTVKSC